MSYDIEVKSVPPTLVLTQHNPSTYAVLKETAYNLSDKAKKNLKGSVFCLSEFPYLKADSMLKVCCPIDKPTFAFDKDKFKVEVIQRTKVVTAIHMGEYNDLEDIFQALHEYIEKNQLTAHKPYRIIFHKEKRAKERPSIFKKPENKYVTEVQIPLFEEETD